MAYETNHPAVDGETPLAAAPSSIPTTTQVTEPLDDALADPTLPRVPGTTATP
jgi:hypothetical protein